MDDTIIFLNGVIRFVPKQTFVKINADLFEIGPSGVKVVGGDQEPEYTVIFEEPLEKTWKNVIHAMKIGAMTITKKNSTTNLGPYVANIVGVLI